MRKSEQCRNFFCQHLSQLSMTFAGQVHEIHLDAASQAALGGKTALKGWYKALEDLVWLTQLGLNMLLPLVLCLAGCWWAVERWNWPEWLFLPAVLLGLAAGAQNFWVFCKERLDRSKKEKNHRVGFNSHQ